MLQFKPSSTDPRSVAGGAKSTMTKSALITGATGQDGAHFSRFFVLDLLLGNPVKAKAGLGWQAKADVSELIRMMVPAGIRRVERE
jgi:GDP-D-mannose dehydratase